MYTTRNILIFLNKKGISGKLSEEIMARCHEKSHEGIILEGGVEEIFVDQYLSDEFSNIPHQPRIHSDEAIQPMLF